jgi:hypothetical protein
LIGTAQSTTSTSTLVITTTTAATRGQFIVVRVASDNASATTPTFTCADSAGNTYTTVVQQARNATANAGVSGAIMSAFVTNPLPSGGTITITLSTARAQKAAYAETFNDVLGLRTSGTANNSGASTAPTVTSPSATNGDLVVGAIAIESNAAPSAFDTDTTNGTWSTVTGVDRRAEQDRHRRRHPDVQLDDHLDGLGGAGCGVRTPQHHRLVLARRGDHHRLGDRTSPHGVGYCFHGWQR